MFLVYEAASNAIANMTKQKIATGFGFWNNTAGFDIGQRLVPYETTSSYGRAFWVGLVNTLLVAGIGIVLATMLGFIIGVARLSKNVLVNKLAAIYVEVIRNTPLLLQLLFWYNAVLKALPEVRDSVAMPGGFFLNNRGLFMPEPVFGASFSWVTWALSAGLMGYFAYGRWARKRQERTGQQSPVLLVGFGLVIAVPLLIYIAAGQPLSFNIPDLGRFNIRGGVQVYPEFVALLLGLVIYTAAFIAEVVRAGIQAVSKGQTEAAYALGLRPGPTLDLVVIPQAMRVIIPPLTSQYLNLTKNSSLAVAVGYPDLVQVFMGTVLNQTGQAVEVIAITMAVYLTISLFTSLVMNWYNSRKALVER
ncbi:amino acid ABC transporter permease [Rhabdaerophilum sp. SD176]|uniref:amino acid ABC transporter permease n=1 Tax=Rhabdaerophilum sp. SD176 TaxID=2983548 RepID=UPI0024DFAC1E|nr:amino acid ABC transporter permease [Rhabdaerophilum sp. SD176]